MTTTFLLGEHAEGLIQAGSGTHSRIDEFVERLSSGEFHVPTDIAIPCACIDGRCGCWARPDAAGGTLSLAVADDLLDQRFAGDGTTLDMVRNVFHVLSAQGLPVGDHTDEYARGDASGCGANDKLMMIYDVIQRKSNELRELAAGLGVTATDADHEAIIHGAARRSSFSTGREVLEVIQQESPKENVDTLIGPHQEIAAVINMRPASTLDRDALAVEFGETYQAFNVDVWAFENGARAIYGDADDATIQRTVTAIVYYNLATALTLCGPNMRLAVLR